MLRRTLMAGLMLAPLFLSACEDKDTTGPEGTPGTVSIRAYVDSDGSGTFTTGDDPISGASVTLTSIDDDAQTSATTNAEGLATFASVTPGSYTASLSGSAPEGAVLSSASTPTIVIPFSGGEVSSEFRFVYNPGSISGQLFRDNNSNNVFDAGDTPAPGQVVSIFSGTDTTVAPVATTTTDNNGVFTFTTLRPGEYTIKIAAIPTISIVGGATQVVTVGAAEAFALSLRFTGNLIGTIAEARAAAVGTTVAVEGVVTAGKGIYHASSIFIQDETGGIYVFGLPSAINPVIGDRVRVVATRGVFNDDVQLATPTVSIIGTGPVPAPRVVTGEEIKSFAFQGELATISRVRVVSIGGGTGAGFDVRVVDGAGTEFVVRVAGTGTGLTRESFTVGNFYDITGALNRFRTTAQLSPRSPADVGAAAEAISIAEARTHSAGDTVIVEGVVYVAQGNFNAASVYIQDATGGTTVFNVPTSLGLVQGDSIRVRGAVGFFSGEFQIARFSSTSPPVIEKLGTGTVPAPKIITRAQLASRAFDGQLVRLLNLRVDSMQTQSATGTGSFNVHVTAPDGVKMVVRVDNRATGITNATFTVGTLYDISGAALNFGTTTVTPQIKPRSPADITPSAAPAGVISIADAKARAVGDTVIVEGVVISGTPGLSGGAIYIQDASGGTQVFQSGGIPVSVGDYVRVRGAVALFSGEKHIARLSSTSPVEVTTLGVGGLPEPRVVTGAELLGRTFEGTLVRLNEVTVTAISSPSTSASSLGAYNVDVTTPDGSVVRVRMESPKGNVVPPSTFTVGAKYDLIGIAAAFNSVAQLKPRTAADVIAR